MPKQIQIDFTSPGSHLGGMIVTAHQHVDRSDIRPVPDPEKPYHGAPDTLQLVQGDMAKDPYWEVAKKLKQSLDQTPDYANVRSAEVKSNWQNFVDPDGQQPDWNYPNTSGRHNLSGGKHATIDTIRREHIATVAAKSLRELRAMGAIDETDYKAGLSQVAMAGIGQVRSPSDDPKYKSGSEMVPSYECHGYGMSRATREYLAAKPPPKNDGPEHKSTGPQLARSMAP